MNQFIKIPCCRFRYSFRSIFAVAVVSVCIGHLSAQESPPNPFRQFGHDQDWQLSLPTFDSETIAFEATAAGIGLSQIVGTENTIYVASGKRINGKTKKETTVSSTLARYNLDDMSAPVWSHVTRNRFRGNQQTFGAAGPAAQATPLLIDEMIIHVSFAGDLVCLNTVDGKLIWQMDLVESFSATPVDFGFSSSPVVDPQHPGRFLILAAGQNGGLLNIEAATGKVIWKAASESFSYATPTVAKFGGVEQWIIVSQTNIMGVAQNDGRLLWEHPLANPGQTNVPTPLVVDEQTLLISGQGVKGTRCLEITRTRKDSESWSLKTRWFERRLEFFYTNWLVLDSNLAAICSDKFLTVFDIQTGNVLGKFRGFGNGNLVRINATQLLVLDGKGTLHLIQLSLKNGSVMKMTETASFPVPKSLGGRCWTPISNVGDRLWARIGENIIAIDVAPSLSTAKSALVASQLSQPKTLELKTRTSAPKQAEADPVELIFAAFQDQGQEEALKLYAQLRADQKLSIEDRLKIVEAAKAQGLSALAKMIAGHIKQDFPDFQSDDQR